MKKCLIIINKNAGSSKKISFAKVECCLGSDFSYDHLLLPSEKKASYFIYDAVAVCGGDGTLSTILQDLYNLDIEVFYFPSGTLNDKAKAKRYRASHHECGDSTEKVGKHTIVGIANDRLFTYVLAAGSFTPIGYETNTKFKQRFGILAYVGKVLKEYKVHRITAEVTIDGDKIKGEYTLIMLLKSPRCFGFPFNHAFDENKVSGHLIAVKSPKHNGILGKIEMFFDFFRIFFIGLKKEKTGKILFKEFSALDINFDKNYHFCQDGEHQIFEKHVHVVFAKSKCTLAIVKNF